MAQTTSRSRRPSPSKSLLQSSDFDAYLREKADEIAPGDVHALLGQGETARRRAAQEGRRHPRLQRQIDVALQLIGDHAAGKCPQIPYHTVSMLAVAVLYFLDPLDVIPDWIPAVGTSDDALILELAFEASRAGVERYCLWKDIATDGLLPNAKKPPPKRARARRR